MKIPPVKDHKPPTNVELDDWGKLWNPENEKFHDEGLAKEVIKILIAEVKRIRGTHSPFQTFFVPARLYFWGNDGETDLDKDIGIFELDEPLRIPEIISWLDENGCPKEMRPFEYLTENMLRVKPRWSVQVCGYRLSPGTEIRDCSALNAPAGSMCLSSCFVCDRHKKPFRQVVPDRVIGYCFLASDSEKQEPAYDHEDTRAILDKKASE